MAEFTRQQESLIKARDELASLSVTVRSKDRAVEVTVGPQGEPTGLRFLNNKHQAMSAQALATSVLEVMAAARREVGRQAAAHLDQFTSGTAAVAGSNLEELNLDRLLEPLAGEDLLTHMRPGNENEDPDGPTPEEGRQRG
ncbi:YbaB/EbfC family nucleoid-associated protein [Streptomyces canus]|uniref:YbaB/EbfC family nucleoid-associated protein n=1 Tax=Streptomyces canus TaxID=58343 RepID=UPI0033FA4F23